LDIAKDAINYANKNFGDFFYNTDIKEYEKTTSDKFDLIIATEVIEHLEDPNDFLETCIRLLKPYGYIILTTPDKDYSERNSIWQTDPPPVHISWIGKKGIKILAKRHNLDVVFQDYSKYYSKFENRLVKFILMRNEKIGNHVLSKEGDPIIMNSSSSLRKKISFFFHKIPPIRFLSNLLYNLVNGSEITLGIILKKNF